MRSNCNTTSPGPVWREPPAAWLAVVRTCAPSGMRAGISMPWQCSRARSTAASAPFAPVIAAATPVGSVPSPPTSTVRRAPRWAAGGSAAGAKTTIVASAGAAASAFATFAFPAWPVASIAATTRKRPSGLWYESRSLHAANSRTTDSAARTLMRG